ncbi:MAG: DUF4271 domain-containing protein [Rikenellaceae bacterium]
MQDTLNIETQRLPSSYLLEHLDSTDVVPYKIVSFADDVTIVFGADARVMSSVSNVSKLHNINNNQFVTQDFFGFLLITVVMSLYVMMLVFCGRVIPALFKSFTYKESIDRLILMSDFNMERLLKISDILIYVLVAYVVMIIYNSFASLSLSAIYIFLIVLVVGIVYGVYKMFLTKILKYISEKDDFFSKLILFNRSNGALATIIFLPIALLVSFVDLSVVSPLIITILVLFGLFIIHYLIALLYFFKQEKVSFLEYILYLCGAEIIPISFIIMLALRNFVS